MSSPYAGFTSVDLVHAPGTLAAILYRDDIEGWERHPLKQFLELGTWIENNALHAVEACPRVMEHWTTRFVPDPHQRGGFYAALAFAMEGLSDEVKARIVAGKCQGPVQWSLFDFMDLHNGLDMHPGPRPWTRLSPAWIGAPGSMLRATAVEHHWRNDYLLYQVYNTLDKSVRTPSSWHQWLECPHTLAMLHRVKHFANEKALRDLRVSKNLAGPNGFVIQTAQPWAQPQDMALSRSVAKHTIGVEHAFVLPPQAQPVPPEIQTRMDAFVRAYTDLDMLKELEERLMSGMLPKEGRDTVLELPESGLLGW